MAVCTCVWQRVPTPTTADFTVTKIAGYVRVHILMNRWFFSRFGIHSFTLQPLCSIYEYACNEHAAIGGCGGGLDFAYHLAGAARRPLLMTTGTRPWTLNPSKYNGRTCIWRWSRKVRSPDVTRMLGHYATCDVTTESPSLEHPWHFQPIIVTPTSPKRIKMALHSSLSILFLLHLNVNVMLCTAVNLYSIPLTWVSSAITEALCEAQLNSVTHRDSYFFCLTCNIPSIWCCMLGRLCNSATSTVLVVLYNSVLVVLITYVKRDF